MNTFFIIHLVLGIWLAIVNFTPIMASSSLASNNIIIGIIIALYNAYYLFAKRDVEAEQQS
ncbi:MAG: hypothetical protein GX334_06280 [Firmicutes bacterium]|nr:hypothetical protein [Bacillota bacterium]